MRYYLAFDGGGTKLQGVLFDEDYRILSSAKSGGVSGTIHSRDEVDHNIRACVEELFRSAGRTVPSIETVYSSQPSRYQVVLQEFLVCNRFRVCGEGTLGILTSGLTSGICALSGTGSDVFYVKDGVETDVLGGWGYALGDPGSGFAIGQSALDLLLLRSEGIRAPTILDEIILKREPLFDKGAIISTVYSQPSPAHYIASFCKCVNEAAQSGDEASREILYEAGAVLAKQAAKLADKHHLPDNVPYCTTGSVFRHCIPARQGFEETLGKIISSPYICHPMFEPVIGGVLYCMFENGEPLNEANYDELKENCKRFCIQ